MGMTLLLIALFWLIDSKNPGKNWGTILVMFLLQIYCMWVTRHQFMKGLTEIQSDLAWLMSQV